MFCGPLVAMSGRTYSTLSDVFERRSVLIYCWCIPIVHWHTVKCTAQGTSPCKVKFQTIGGDRVHFEVDSKGNKSKMYIGWSLQSTYPLCIEICRFLVYWRITNQMQVQTATRCIICVCQQLFPKLCETSSS